MADQEEMCDCGHRMSFHVPGLGCSGSHADSVPCMVGSELPEPPEGITSPYALAEWIDLHTDSSGAVRRIVVDGVDIGGWLAGTEVSVVSSAGKTEIRLAITAPLITYNGIE